MAQRETGPMLGQCPRFRCDGREVERTNRSTGQRFVGCSQYPECRQSRPLHFSDFGEWDQEELDVYRVAFRD